MGTVTVIEVSPAGTAHHPALVAVTTIEPVGVRHYPGTVAVTGIWVQLGDFPAPEGRGRYLSGDGAWVPALAEHVWLTDHWVSMGD